MKILMLLTFVQEHHPHILT